MAQAQLKTPAVKNKPAAKVEEATQTPKEMAQPEKLEVHTGKTPSSFRVGKKLTPLRHDYRCGAMSVLDAGFLRDCISIADKDGKFKRLNADAGRLGRLYRLEFVTYDEIGVSDREQIIALTTKAFDYVKAVTANPDAAKAKVKPAPSTKAVKAA